MRAACSGVCGGGGGEAAAPAEGALRRRAPAAADPFGAEGPFAVAVPPCFDLMTRSTLRTCYFKFGCAF